MDEERCDECGALVQGGRAGCQALFDELAAQAIGDYRYGAVYRLALDSYCMQHLERYCRSAKSYAAHLTGLCCGLEHGGNATIYEAIPHWLNGAAPIEKPAVLRDRGQMTVLDVRAAQTVEAHCEAVRAWAENVWAAYAVQHELAREWIQAALVASKRPRPR